MITRFFRLFTALGLTALVLGCATPRIVSDVTAFHEWPAAAAIGSRTYRLVRQPAQANSLEHATYEQGLRAELARAGFTEQANGRFLIGFDYSIGSQVSRVVDPWVNSSISVGTGWNRGGLGVGIGVPIGGWGWPYYGGVREVVVYERRLRLLIDDTAQAGRRVFESNVTSIGSNRNLAEVLPLMARGLLNDFPGQSGAGRRVEVEIPKKP